MIAIVTRDWATFGAEFRARGLGLPLHEGEDDLERWLRLIMTAWTAAPVGWRYSALPDVAHYLHNKHPGLL